MASIEEDGWELYSAVERNRDAPTFSLPAEDSRRTVPIGHVCKLLFVIPAEVDADGDLVCQTERMWVEVTERTEDGYRGVLVSTPFTPSDSLRAGSVVNFEPDHIAEIQAPPLSRRLKRRFGRA